MFAGVRIVFVAQTINSGGYEIMKGFFAKGPLIATIIVALQLAVTHVRAWESPELKPLLFKPNPHSAWNYGGHLEAGLYANQYGQKNAYDSNGNLLGASGNTTLLQNVQQSDLQLNQAWLFFEKKVNGRCGWDIGGRVDYVFGTDARYTQSSGLEYNTGHGQWGEGDYYSALAQMYMEAGYKNVSIKFGKFMTPMGIDPLVSTDRFFYSLSKNFGLLPVTHTGVLVTWDASQKFSIFGGWTQGENMFFDTSKNNAFLGGFEYKFNPCTKWGFTLMAGENSRDNEEYYTHSLYLKHKFSKRWDYTAEWVYNNRDYSYADVTSNGLNSSLYYTVNCKWALGFRAEWLNYDYGLFDIDTYGLVFGANWKPCDWLLIRPEIRYDSVHGYPGSGPFNQYKGVGKSDQFAGGFSTVMRF